MQERGQMKNVVQSTGECHLQVKVMTSSPSYIPTGEGEMAVRDWEGASGGRSTIDAEAS